MRVVLRETIGGLGDAIVFSTLPELYAKAGHEVYISSDTKSRNPEVYDLLYRRNPYINGVSDEGEIRAGNCHGKEHFRLCRVSANPIGLIERLHGFQPVNDRPKVYYEPKKLSEWEDAIFVDPRSISQGFPAATFDRWFKRMAYALDPATIVVASSIHAGASGYDALMGCPRYELRDIYEYIDIIASCKYFFATESGGQSLAAAVRAGGTYALTTTMTYNSRFFIYPNVIYGVTGRISDDYIPNDEIGI